MFEPKDIKKNLNIKPISVIIFVLGGIASTVTIFSPFIDNYYEFYNVLIFILIAMLITFSAIFLKRLYGIKDEFNDDIKDYNSLLKSYYLLEKKYNLLEEEYNDLEKKHTILDKKYMFSEENRESLSMMVEDKTMEVDELKVEIVRFNGLFHVLLKLYSVPEEYRPDEKDMRMIIEPDKEKE